MLKGAPDDADTLNRLRLDLVRAATDFRRVEQEQTGKAAKTPVQRGRREVFGYFQGLRQRHLGHIGDWTPTRVRR